MVYTDTFLNPPPAHTPPGERDTGMIPPPMVYLYSYDSK